MRDPFGGPFPAPPYTSEHTFHEILTLVSHLAGVTSTIAFVTSVLVLPQRQTALAAKQIATIDLLSGGRLRVAVGAGWNRAEYEGLGAEFDSRRDRLEEQVDVLRRLWTEPLVSFGGRFHELDRVGINPLPSRPIPIYVGSGAADPVLRRVVRVADGWMPLLHPRPRSAHLAPRCRAPRRAVPGGGPRSGVTADPRPGLPRRRVAGSRRAKRSSSAAPTCPSGSTDSPNRDERTTSSSTR